MDIFRMIKFSPRIYLFLLLYLLFKGYDIKPYLYFLPTPYLVAIAYFDNAFADLQGYIVKHHKFIFNLVLLRYVFPYAVRLLFKRVSRRVPAFSRFGHGREGPSGGVCC